MDKPSSDKRFDHWQNLWAPWRMEYIESLDNKPSECFLCDYVNEIDKDAENLVVMRRKNSFALMNRFPYTGGHMLVAPYSHASTMDNLDGEVLKEMMLLCRDCQKILFSAIKAEGFNVGFNIGRIGGAGLPGHLHMHVVPRWDGDTNFMTVLGDVRVIPQAMDAIYARLKDAADKL